jgi:large conductance mechanosensitive channel
MKGFVNEFKAFAMKGNVIDLAVAVVIGAAFGKIVSSLVANIITPLVGVLMGGVNLSGLSVKVGDAMVTYGVFIQSIIDFLIVALVIFMVIKGINKAQGAFDGEDKVNAEGREGGLGQVEDEAKPVEPTEEVKLLREIRDGLRR